MSRADSDTRTLHQVLRILRQDKVSPASCVEELYSYLFENRDVPVRQSALSALGEWQIDELRRAFDLSEEIIAQYTRRYYDPREIPVTYYKRERKVRRYLDEQFSRLFRELMERSGQHPEAELITQEPIYYLMQQAREKKFPKSKDGRASLGILRTRLHLGLSRRIETGPDSRKILLPHEIR